MPCGFPLFGHLRSCLALAVCTLGLVGQAQAQYSISGLTIRGGWTFSESATSVSPVVQMSGSYGLMMLRQDGSVITSCAGTPPGFDIPKDLPPLKQICAGDMASAGVTFDGKVVTWGNSPYDIRPPLGLDRVKTVTTDGTHFVALRLDGSVVAWGDNSLGQSNVPAVLPKIIGIAALPSTTFLLGEDGKLIQLGTVQSRSDWKTGDPERKSDFTRIAAGRENLVAIRADGSGAYFGNYSADPTTKRFEIQPLNNVVEIYCNTYAVAHLADGTFAVHNSQNSNAWEQLSRPVDAIAVGKTNYRAQVWVLTGGEVELRYVFRYGNHDSYWEPPMPRGYPSLKDLDGGAGFALLGDGRVLSLNSGLPLPAITNAKQLERSTQPSYPGYRGIAILRNDGSVVDESGLTPDFLKGKTFTAISKEYESFLGLTKDGKVFSDGGVYGNSDIGTPSPTPSDLPPATAVVASGYVCMALLKNGQVRVWPNERWVGQPPAGLSRVVKIAASLTDLIALQSDGTVVAWNSNGLLPWSGRTGITDIYAETVSSPRILLRTRDGAWVEPNDQPRETSFRGEILSEMLFSIGNPDDGQPLVASMVSLPSFTVKLRSAEVVRGTSLVGEVALRVPAPTGGQTVALASASSAIQIPSSVTVKAGQLGTTFLVKTASTTSEPQAVQIAATLGRDTQRASFLISTPLKVTLDKPSVIGGTTDRVRATVSLGKTATKDTVVALTYVNSALHGPAAVTIPLNQSNASFDLTADLVPLVSQATFTATVNTQRASVNITIAVPTVRKLTAPTTVVGGDSFDTTIELTAPVLAPMTVRIGSSDPDRIAPFDIVVPALSNTATASVRCRSYSEVDDRRVPIPMVTLSPPNNPTLQAQLAIPGAYFSSLLPIAGGRVTATLNLDRKRTSDRTYFLSGDANLTTPASVTIPAGKDSVDFPVDCVADATRRFRLEAIGEDGKAVLVGNIGAADFRIGAQPSRFVGGSATDVTFKITVASSGLKKAFTFEIESSDSSVTLPKTVTIPAGKTQATIKVVHAQVSTTRNVTVTVKLVNISKTLNLVVKAP